MSNEDFVWYEEPIENIRRCLSCEKPECTNCLEYKMRRILRLYPVIQCHAGTDIEIRRFNTVREAEEELKINSSSIYAVLRGERKTAGGYSWLRAKEAAGDEKQ